MNDTNKLYDSFAWLRKTILPILAGLAVTIIALSNAELLGGLLPASVVTMLLPVCNWIAKVWKKQLEKDKPEQESPEDESTKEIGEQIYQGQASNVGDISEESKASYLPETEVK